MNFENLISNYHAKLPNGFELRSLTQEEFKPLWDKYYPVVFGMKAQLDVRATLSQNEIEQMESLAKMMGSPLCIRLGVFKSDQFVGWHFGDQKSREEFYMRNSGVLPEMQGQGIYAAMLIATMELLKQVGFQVISSKHNATNNRVIIPKLKAGFVISGLEISDKFGTLVRLEYFTNKTRREIMDYRCGQELPGEHIRPLVGL